MALFLGKFTSKIDAKGRLSVPAAFRDELAEQNFKGIVAFPSLKLPAIEASGIDWIEELARRRDLYDGFSDEYDAFATIFNESHRLAFDGEGRIILPEGLIEHAGLRECAIFAGNSRSFEIWEPQRYAERREQRRVLVRERGLTLPVRPARPTLVPGDGP